MTGCLLSMPHGHGDSPFRGNHIPSRKYPGVTCHHRFIHLNHPIFGYFNPGDIFQKRGIHLLTQGQDDGIDIHLFKLSCGLWSSFLIQLHDFNRKCRFINLFNGPKPPKHDALLKGLFNLKSMSGHMFLIPPINDHGFFRPQSVRRSSCINGSVSASVNGNTTPDLRFFRLFHLV